MYRRRSWCTGAYSLCSHQHAQSRLLLIVILLIVWTVGVMGLHVSYLPELMHHCSPRGACIHGATISCRVRWRVQHFLASRALNHVLLLRRTMCGSSDGMMYACTPLPPSASAMALRSASSLGSVGDDPLAPFAPAMATAVLLRLEVKMLRRFKSCELRRDDSWMLCTGIKAWSRGAKCVAQHTAKDAWRIIS